MAREIIFSCDECGKKIADGGFALFNDPGEDTLEISSFTPESNYIPSGGADQQVLTCGSVCTLRAVTRWMETATLAKPKNGHTEGEQSNG